VAALLGAVGGALAALLGIVSPTYALVLPLVLPVVSLIAALQREDLVKEVRWRRYDVMVVYSPYVSIRKSAYTDFHHSP
jgi:hypothetical protein